MLLVDSRVGSKDLVELLPDAELTTLTYADVAFLGNGPTRMVSIGIEVKTVHDIVNCIYDGRFAGHQLPGLLQNYAHIWLIAEGEWKADKKGRLLIPYRDSKGRKRWCTFPPGKRTKKYAMRAVALRKWFISMEVLSERLRVWRTRDRAATVQAIKDLYSWWTDSRYDEHRSLSAIRETPAPGGVLRKPSLLRMYAKELDGIGWKLSSIVEKHFSTINSMVNATVEDWQKIPGVGKTIAGKAVDDLHKKYG